MKIYLAIREDIYNEYSHEIEGAFTKKERAEHFCAKNKLALYEYDSMDDIYVPNTEIFKTWEAIVEIDGKFRTIVSRLSQEPENKSEFMPYFKPYFVISVSLSKESTQKEAVEALTKKFLRLKEQNEELFDVSMEICNKNYGLVERLEQLSQLFNSED